MYMAVGRKTGGRNFTKGNTQGGGRKREPAWMKEVKKKLGSFEGRILLAKYVLMEYRELKSKIEDHNNTAIELMIMRIIEKGVSKGDLPILMWLYSKVFEDQNDIKAENNIIKLNYNFDK